MAQWESRDKKETGHGYQRPDRTPRIAMTRWQPKVSALLVFFWALHISEHSIFANGKAYLISLYAFYLLKWFTPIEKYV